jgi:nucleoside-diphosphate kinase
LASPTLTLGIVKPDAVAQMRTVIGATDPAEAAPNTIRKLFAESKGKNAIHASDSPENAAREIAFFFTEGELAGLWG